MHPPVLPVVRRLTSPPTALRIAHEQPHLALVRRPIGPWMTEVLIEDRVDRIRYVQHQDLAAWGIEEDALWLAARSALAARAHEAVQPIEGGVQGSNWGGFASSLVLLPGFLDSLADRLTGSPVVLAPDVDHLVVVGTQHPQLSEWLTWAFDTFRQTERPLSPAPLFHPTRAPRNLRLLQAFAYAEQDEVLLETAPDGVYIGELSLRLTGDAAVTRTQVEPGYPCWLPEADEVLTPTGVVPFDSLDLQRLDGLEPPRWVWNG